MARDPRPAALGDYEICDFLGRGGMGELYRARKKGTAGPEVAIKCVRAHPAGATHSNRARMFLHEARVATLLHHPNIVQVFDVDYRDGYFYIAMELLDGWDLHAINVTAEQLGRQLPVPHVLVWISEACQGLHAAHTCKTERGDPLHLVHRDISPANLFVTRAGSLKILDFGVAKSTLQTAQTMIGVVKGKLSYVAPEHYRGESLDGRADIFAIGVVLHEMLSGRRLFKRDLPIDTERAIMSGFVPPPARANEALPEAIVATVMRALRRERDLRHSSAAELSRELEAVLTQIGRPSPTEIAAYLQQLMLSDDAAKVTAVTKVGTTELLTDWAARITTVLGPEALEGLPGERPLSPFDVAAAVDPGPSTPRDTVADPVRRRAWRWPVAGAAAMLIALAATAVVLQRPPPAPPVLADDAIPAGDTAPSVAPPPPPTPAGDAASANDPPPAPPSPARVQPPPRPVSAPSPRTAVRQPRRPAPVATGRLTLEVKPWAKVYLGERLLGASPIVERELPAGRTTLRLVNPETGLTRTVTVTIPVDDVLRSVIDLRAPAP